MSAVMTWLNGLPAIVLFVGLIALGLLLAAGMTWFATRLMEDEVRTKTSLSVVAVVGVVAALYSVLVAFVIVNEWQAFNDAQAQVSNESGALTAAYFDAGVLAKPVRTEIQTALLNYDRSVICVEIPYLSNHQGPALPTRRALQQVYATMANASPSVQASPFYASAVDQVAQIATARRARINAASSPLPSVLVVVILVTSVLLVAVVSVLDTQHRRWHLVLTTGLTVLVAINFALIVTLNRPFDGAASISAAPLREGIPSRELRCHSPAPTTTTRQP